MTTPPSDDPPSDARPPIAALASACAAKLPAHPSTFNADAGAFDTAWQALVAAVAGSDPGYMFDRAGRPDAIMAVRHALPAMERELFEAIMEDVTCELAAVQEALYRIALTIRDGSPAGHA
jgi:hypothetical protein